MKALKLSRVMTAVKWLACGFALTFASTAMASEWVKAHDSESYRVMGDESTRRREGDFAYIWEKYIITSDDGKEWEESKQLRVANCRTRQRGMMSVIRYRTNGDMAMSYDYPLSKVDWSNVVPDSLGDELFQYECRG